MISKLLLAAALAFTPALAAAQSAADPAAPTAPTAPAAPAAPAVEMEDADPALWVVRDADTTVYLFGTFHLLDARPWFNDEVRAAFDTSDELVLEAIVPENPAEMAPLVLRYAVDPQGRRLSERLSPERYAALTEAMARVGVPAETLDRLEPWFAAMTLAAAAGQQLGISAEHGTERVLMRAAAERNIPVGELEGVEWQLRLFDEMPERQQLEQLEQALDDAANLTQEMAPMLAAWSTGDVEALVGFINDNHARDPVLHRLIFTDRNAAWARWIEERLERPGTVFLAVGAGHLAGDDSVQAALASRGLTARRVPPPEAPQAP